MAGEFQELAQLVAAAEVGANLLAAVALNVFPLLWLGRRWRRGGLLLDRRTRGSPFSSPMNCDTDTFGGIEHIRAILLELYLQPRYDNQPTKDDFDAFWGARGFACTFAHYGTNSTDHANLLYRRR